jgi:hypothetical protein
MDTKPSTYTEVAPATCISCGATLHGPWCAACGQRVLNGRHTLRRFALTGLAHVLDLDRGFLHTVVRLTTAPGRTIREFVAGATARYTHPAAYLLVGFAAFAITGRLAGGEAGLADGGNRVFTATAVPVVAGVARVIFWQARLNYAEHLIATMYLVGHVVLGLAAVQAVAAMVPLNVSTSLGLAGIVAGVGYFSVGYGRTLGRRPWLSAAGGLAALGVGLTIWGLALARVVAMFRVG